MEDINPLPLDIILEIKKQFEDANLHNFYKNLGTLTNNFEYFEPELNALLSEFFDKVTRNKSPKDRFNQLLNIMTWQDKALLLKQRVFITVAFEEGYYNGYNAHSDYHQKEIEEFENNKMEYRFFIALLDVSLIDANFEMLDNLKKLGFVTPFICYKVYIRRNYYHTFPRFYRYYHSRNTVRNSYSLPIKGFQSGNDNEGIKPLLDIIFKSNDNWVKQQIFELAACGTDYDVDHYIREKWIRQTDFITPNHEVTVYLIEKYIGLLNDNGILTDYPVEIITSVCYNLEFDVYDCKEHDSECNHIIFQNYNYIVGLMKSTLPTRIAKKYKCVIVHNEHLAGVFRSD
jgi:hypothetical protein